MNKYGIKIFRKLNQAFLLFSLFSKLSCPYQQNETVFHSQFEAILRDVLTSLNILIR